MDTVRNFLLPPITAEYNREEQRWFYRELHGWKVTSFFGTLVADGVIDTRKDRFCRPQHTLKLQNLFGYIFQKFLWPIDWTQIKQKQDWLVLQLNQQPTLPWPTPKVKRWSLSGYPLPHAELESQFRRATCVVLLDILWRLQFVTGAT